MNILPPTQPFTFPKTAVAGDQVTRTVRIENATTSDVVETATVTATLVPESATLDLPITFEAPSAPTVTVADTPGATFTVGPVVDTGSGTFRVDVTATKL